MDKMIYLDFNTYKCKHYLLRRVLSSILSESLEVNECYKGQVSLDLKCDRKIEFRSCIAFTFLTALWMRKCLFPFLLFCSLYLENHCLEWMKIVVTRDGLIWRTVTLEFLKFIQFVGNAAKYSYGSSCVCYPIWLFPLSISVTRCICFGADLMYRRCSAVLLTELFLNLFGLSPVIRNDTYLSFSRSVPHSCFFMYLHLTSYSQLICWLLFSSFFFFFLPISPLEELWLAGFLPLLWRGIPRLSGAASA